MMKSAGATVLLLLLLLPSAAPAVKKETNWRNRISSEADLVATSDIVEEIRFGRAVAARIIGRFGLYENVEVMKYVNLVGQTLTRSASRPEIEFYFAVLNGDEVMSFGAPGGYIFVTIGALRAMQDEAELAGVLAHEMGHIGEKTAVREFEIRGIESTGVSSLAHVIDSSADPERIAFQKAVDKAMDMLSKNGYSSEDEEKADEEAVLLCAMAGYDPSGLVRYNERTRGIMRHAAGALSDADTFFDARISRLKSFIQQEGIDSGNAKAYENRFTRYMISIR